MLVVHHDVTHGHAFAELARWVGSMREVTTGDWSYELGIVQSGLVFA